MTAQVIDCVANLFTPAVVETRPDWSRSHMGGRFGVTDGTLLGVSLNRMLDQMDASGVDVVILLAPIMGPRGTPGHWALPAGSVLDAVERHPDRFRAQVGIDPISDVRGVAELRGLAAQGIVGAHFYPHWFDMAPDDARAYPFYAACEELGMPIQVQVGNALVYSAARPVRSQGRPSGIDVVACDFPGLTIVGSHVGWPWTEEMIAVTMAHPGVHMALDSYAPSHWGDALDGFVAGTGRHDVLWGTMWPTITWERARADIAAKGLSATASSALLGGNAARVYGIR